MIVTELSLLEGTHKVECDENFMIIYLDSRIQTSDTSLITLRDASCTAKLYAPSNQYGLSTTYDKCGTTKKETATHILYENEVTWIFGNDTSGVIRHGGKKINFTCSIDRYQNVSFLSLAPTTSFLTGKEGESFSLFSSVNSLVMGFYSCNKRYLIFLFLFNPFYLIYLLLTKIIVQCCHMSIMLVRVRMLPI